MNAGGAKVKNKLIHKLIHKLILIALCLVVFVIQFGRFDIWPLNLLDDCLLKQVSAAGSTTVNITYTVANSKQYTFASFQSWGAQSTAVNCESFSAGNGAGWTEGPGSSTFAQSEYIMGFDISVIPVGAQITSVNLFTKSHRIDIPTAPSDWKYAYYSMYKTAPMDDVPSVDDWSVSYNAGRIMITSPKRYDSISTVDTWYTWSVFSGYRSQLKSWASSANMVYFTLSSMRRQLNAAPSHWIATGYEMISSAGGNPYLQVTYVSSPVNRTVYVGTNAAVNPAPSGLEVANNITWGSPRCGYADETIYYIVNGDSGANITLRCVGADGTLLAGQIESIRTDGIYNWSFTVPSSYSGWVRAYEQNFGLYSNWGYIDRAPSPAMQNLTTYAYSNEYPQYDNPFSYYAVWKDGLMFVYWSTNVALGEMDTYNLGVWVSGNSTYGSMFDSTLNWLNDNYYSTNYTANRYLSANRFMIFCPQIISSGYNSGNGLIYNLNQEYDLSTCGFIVPVIRNNTTGEVITTCHSAYYYIQNWINDGVNISADSMVIVNGVIGVYINVGKYSMIPDRLANLTVQLIDNLGFIYNTATGSVIAGQTVAGLTAPNSGGDYQVRCTFSSVTSPYYSLILDVPITITGGTELTTAPVGSGTGGGPAGSSVSDWTGRFKALIKKYGLDNEAGHWLIILLLCAAWVWLLRKSPTAMTGMIVLTIGGGLILQWLNPWFYALVILGAGLTIFGLFKKKTKSSDEG